MPVAFIILSLSCHINAKGLTFPVDDQKQQALILSMVTQLLYYPISLHTQSYKTCYSLSKFDVTSHRQGSGRALLLKNTHANTYSDLHMVNSPFSVQDGSALLLRLP